ncbi:MAG: peptidoglycan D,D-transpeptidase FtsI family protein [Minisyncoccota bacterium]
MRSANTLTRFWVLYVFMACIAGASLWRLFSLQVIQGKAYAEAAQRQYVNPSSGLFDRGAIVMEEKDGTRMSAATIAYGAKLIVDGTKIGDAERVYAMLSPIVSLDHTNFIRRTSVHTDVYIEIAHHLTTAQASAITALKIPGLSLEAEQWRTYPGGGLAAHVIGLVGYDGTNTLAGRYGLERYYNDVLERATTSSLNFFAEIFGEIKKEVFDRTPREGDIVTTIEPNVQAMLEDSLKAVQAKWHPEEGGAIIINPKTGEVYAMAAFPSFNPNDFSHVASDSVFINPLVERAYEMGSIIKPLVMAGALDMGAVTPSTTYNDTGTIKIDGATIHNYDNKARGVIPMQEILSQSLNVGMAFVAHQMGNADVRKYLLGYGIGEETGIDLPGEIHGTVSNLSSPRALEYATASFGQGISMTPIETVRALSALGNGGYLIDPHMVKEIDYTVGPKTIIAPNPPQQVLKPGISEAITRMLVRVVDEKLANGAAKMDHYAIAAKTGTAQIAYPHKRGYYDDRYLHSFFGYFPAYDPQFLVFYYIVHPLGAQYASNTLTDSFVNTTKFLINYYQLPPDR